MGADRGDADPTRSAVASRLGASCGNGIETAVRGRAVSGRPAASGDGAIRPRAEAARARGGGCGGSGVGQRELESA